MAYQKESALTYQRMSKAECAAKDKQFARKLMLELIGTVTFGVSLLALLYYLKASGFIPHMIATFLLGAAIILTLLRIAQLFVKEIHGSDFLELNEHGYTHAVALAKTSKAAADALQSWTNESKFLAVRDLNELKRLGAQDQDKNPNIIRQWRQEHVSQTAAD